MNYNFIGKDERKENAKKHTEDMMLRFPLQIATSIEMTKIYTGPLAKKTVETIVTDRDTVSELFQHRNQMNVAVLNFASYKNPGGMFLEGSRAQEECLCHESFLYNVLKTFDKTYYEANRKNKNKALYTDRALYTPEVIFEREINKVKERSICSVITCAAPNKSAAKKYMNISDEENAKALRERIRFILDIAEENKVQILIAGAYGCGVFGQNPREVATIFKDEIDYCNYSNLSKVIFAIPGGNDNLSEFQKVFGGK